MFYVVVCIVYALTR